MKKVLLLSIIFICGIIYFNFSDKKIATESRAKTLKLYWFIPDGLRAEPYTFKLFEWAKQGKLPNILKLMKRGAWGYSRPTFPSHTPTNFATLLTGSSPLVHGVADGPMRLESYPLNIVSLNGFSSVAKKVPPIWYSLEQNNITSTLISMPGSTPPEIYLGNIIKGRWGGWGFEFPSINFHSSFDKKLRQSMGVDAHLFNLRSPLTKFTKPYKPRDWKINLPRSYSPIQEINLQNWGANFFALLIDDKNDGITSYTKVLFSQNKKTISTTLTKGQWSSWLPITLNYEIKNDYSLYKPKKTSWERGMSETAINTFVKIKVLKLKDKRSFRFRFRYDDLNISLVKPLQLHSTIQSKVGHMVDFVDNFPPQLIYFKEDKATFLEEAKMSLDWHKKMAKFSVNYLNTDVIIHNIYTPNQMLTSRWWMSYLDPSGSLYNKISKRKRDQLWNEVLAMYQGVDAILEEVLQNAGDNTYIVFSSDHGVIPLKSEVHLNNFFAKKGWLKFKYDKVRRFYSVDYKNTKVIYLKMNHIYINPQGLDGPYKRASGAEYKKLRQKVKIALLELTNSKNKKPAEQVLLREESKFLDLPEDRVGDLIVVNKPGFGWTESVSKDLKIFSNSLKGGYKQALNPNHPGLLTPFIISGPGVKKNFKLKKIVKHINQYPTIMTLLKQPIPDFVQGKVLKEIFIKDKLKK